MEKTREDIKMGFSTVEVILSLSLFFFLVLALSGAIFYGLNVRKEAGEESKAEFILDEGIEGLTNIKDSDFSNLIAGNWGLTVNSGQWILTPSSDQTDGYVRQISISNIDDYDKQAIITVSWTSGSGRSRSISSTMRLTNWERLVSIEQPVDWANPTYIGSYDLLNATSGLRVKLGSQKAYICKQPNSEDFQILDLGSLPAISSLSVLSIDGTVLPYDMHLDGDYVYTTSASDTKEMNIINVTNPASPSVVSSLNIEGSANATGVFKQGDYAYVTRLSNSSLNEFHVVNVSNPLSPTVSGSLNLSLNNQFDVVVSGNYAYLATSANAGELTIVNVTNPSAPTFVSALDLATNTDGTRLTYYNGIVYLVQGTNVRIINVSNPAAPVLLSTYAAGGAVGDLITAFPLHPYLFLATANSLREFQVVDVTSPASPVLLGQYNASATLVGIDYDPVNEIVGAVGNNSTGEFLVFSGYPP